MLVVKTIAVWSFMEVNHVPAIILMCFDSLSLLQLKRCFSGFFSSLLRFPLRYQSTFCEYLFF